MRPLGRGSLTSRSSSRSRSASARNNAGSTSSSANMTAGAASQGRCRFRCRTTTSTPTRTSPRIAIGEVPRIEPVGVGGAYNPAVVETHSGLVFLAGARAYKLKKADDLGFLDFTTRGSASGVCEREVELNRRLAPDVYHRRGRRARPVLGKACDHMLVMRRMRDPSDGCPPSCSNGAPVGGILDQLARLIADFHARAGAQPGPPTTQQARRRSRRGGAANTTGAEAIRRPVRRCGDRGGGRRPCRPLPSTGRQPLFEQRVAAGRACDCHCDLLADDIFCLEDGPRVLDCLEFDDALRLDDNPRRRRVPHHGPRTARPTRPRAPGSSRPTARPPTTPGRRRSLNQHLRYGPRCGPRCPRFRADQGIHGSADKAQRPPRAHPHPPRRGPRATGLVGGLPGTGKSTLAAGLGDALSAVVIRSDVVRKGARRARQ